MLIKQEQSIFERTEPIQNDMKHHNEVYKCAGRIQGNYPIYIPKNSKLVEKVVQNFHKKTLHGLVTLTMTTARDQYWISKLRQLTKRIIRNCYGCK